MAETMSNDPGMRGGKGRGTAVATPPTAEGVPLRTLMREDLQAVFERDPSATSLKRVLLYSAGLRIVWSYRWQHFLWTHGHKDLARHGQKRTRNKYGSDIHPAAHIGRRFVVDHGVGVVIGETAVVGDDCLIYQGVTLGMTGKSFSREGKRHPTVGKGVLLGAGAIVLGDITVGDDANVGAGSVVVKPVPAGSTVVGVAAHVIGDHTSCPADDSNWGSMLQTPPDLQRKLDEVGRAFGVERRLGADGELHPVEQKLRLVPQGEKGAAASAAVAQEVASASGLPRLDPADDWYCCL